MVFYQFGWIGLLFLLIIIKPSETDLDLLLKNLHKQVIRQVSRSNSAPNNSPKRSNSLADRFFEVLSSGIQEKVGFLDSKEMLHTSNVIELLYSKEIRDCVIFKIASVRAYDQKFIMTSETIWIGIFGGWNVWK